MEYKFKINNFEGPLDLLLHLIKESEMEITNIEIVKLTDQYLKFINDMKDMNLDIASEYLVMASELAYLKSKSLLPIKDEEKEEYEEAKEDLINRLIEFKQYKEISSKFQYLEEKRKDIFTKAPSSLKEYSDSKTMIGDGITLENLLEAFQKFLERKQSSEPLLTKITTKEFSVDDRISEIRSLFKTKERLEFFELFDNFSKPYVVVTFLSILEMAKNNELIITQENNFDKIYCEVRQ